MKAHVLVNLPEECKAVRTDLSMNCDYSYADYKKHIRHYWYTEPGGNDLMDKGFCVVAGTMEDPSNGGMTTAFYTQGGNGQFKFRCRKCGKVGHKAKDCKTEANDSVNFTGNCNWCGKKGHRE